MHEFHWLVITRTSQKKLLPIRRCSAFPRLNLCPKNNIPASHPWQSTISNQERNFYKRIQFIWRSARHGFRMQRNESFTDVRTNTHTIIYIYPCTHCSCGFSGQPCLISTPSTSNKSRPHVPTPSDPRIVFSLFVFLINSDRYIKRHISH